MITDMYKHEEHIAALSHQERQSCTTTYSVQITVASFENGWLTIASFPRGPGPCSPCPGNQCSKSNGIAEEEELWWCHVVL